MFEDLKTERQRTVGTQNRLMVYVGALLVMGAAIAIAAGLAGTSEVPEKKPEEKEVQTPEAVRTPIDPSKLPQADTDAVHAAYDRGGLDYLLPLVESDYSPEAVRVPLAELVALPFAEARGRVFETWGTVRGIDREVWRRDEERLWSVVVHDEQGNLAIVLKHGLGSDPREARPEDAISVSTEYVQEGDRLLVRGVYLQRRVGTVGGYPVKEPAPVLVATPAPYAFRKLPEPAEAIPDLASAGWEHVRDRNLRETQNLNEPALYQVIQWARRHGHEAIVEDIRTGRIPSQTWGQESFTPWGKEVAAADPDVPRPFTDGARGKLFGLYGYIGSFQRESWRTVPRWASSWDIDTFYVLDLIGDHWAHQGIRCISAWPLTAFDGVTGSRKQRVKVYGFFLKNHTYKGPKVRDGKAADVTMPMFVVVHVAPVVIDDSPWMTVIWIVSAGLLLLVSLFYFVFVRGEQKEAARMEQRRLELRRKRRKGALENPASAGEETPSADDPPDGDDGS